MADEARADVVVNADTEGAKAGVKSLADIFGGLGGSIVGSLFSFNQVADAARTFADVIRFVSNSVQSLISGTWGLVKNFADTGDSIFTMSRKFGIGAETLSTFNYIGDQTNTTAETIGASVFKMGVNIEKGSKQTEIALKAIGTSSRDLKALKPEEQFAKIMAGMQGIPDAGQRALIGVSIFGKGFQSIAQLVDEDLTGMMKNAKAFGLVMTDEMAAAGDQLNDTLSDLSSMFQGLKNIIGGSLLPVVNAFLGTIRDELLVALGMLGDAFTPIFSGFGQFRTDLVDTANSADFHTRVLRTLINTMAYLIDAVGSVVRAFGTLTAAYYEMNTVLNLIKTAWLATSLAVQTSGFSILQILSKLSMGMAGDQFGRWAADVRASMTETAKALISSKKAADEYDAASRAISSTTNPLADKLALLAKTLRDNAAEYQGIATAAPKASAAIKGLDSDLDLTPGKLEGLAKKVDDFKKSIAEMGQEINLAAKHGLPANEMLDTFGKKAEEAVRQAKIFGVQVPLSVAMVYDTFQRKNFVELLTRVRLTVEHDTKALIDVLKDLGQASGEVNDKWIAAVKKWEDTNRKTQELNMSAHERRLAEIEDQRKAELDLIEGVGRAYDMAREAVNRFYDAQRAKARETIGDVIRRTREEDTERRAANLRQAVAYRVLYNDLKLTAQKGSKELQDAWQRMIDAEIAAGIRVKDSYGEIFNGILTVIGAVGRTGSAGFDQIANSAGQVVGAISQIISAMASMKDGMSAANLSAAAAGWAGAAIALYGIAKQANETANAKEIAAALERRAQYYRGLFLAESKFSDQVTADIKKSMADVQQAFGAGPLEETQNRLRALALNINHVIEELGGIPLLTTQQIKVAFQSTWDLLDLIKKGGRVGADATKELDQLIVRFGEDAVRTGGLVSQYFTHALANAKAAGVELAGVNKFVLDQATSAASNLNDLLTGLQGSATNEAKKAAQENIDSLEQQIKDSSGRTKSDLEEKLKLAKDAQEGIVGTFKLTQEQGVGLAAALAADFQEMIARGMSFKDALAAIQPGVEVLRKALSDSGVDGGAAFDLLQRESAIASDTITGPLLQAIISAGGALKGLYNSGILTEEMFNGIASTATQAYNQILAKTGDERAAMAASRATLQTIWELQRKYGYSVDESTQKLLDQAVAAGDVGAKQMSAADRTADSMVRVVNVLEAMAVKMGVTLPAAADQMQKKVSASVDNLGKELNGTPWDEWGDDAEAAAKRAKAAVDGVAVGNSPGGVRQIETELYNAMDATRAFTGTVVSQMQMAKSAAETLKMNGGGSFTATGTAGAGNVVTNDREAVKINLSITDKTGGGVNINVEDTTLPAILNVLKRGRFVQDIREALRVE